MIARFSSLVALILWMPALAVAQSQHWAQWRGPLGTGVAPSADPPVEWSEDKNVAWKVALPGKGHSTPIIWQDRIFLTTAIPFGDAFRPQPDTAPGAHDNVLVTHRHRFVALAVDRSSGEIVWERTLHEARPHEGGHYSGSLASASPVTDGEYLYVSFGSYGLYCVRIDDGELVWEKDLGRMASKHGHGEGSSPALAGETLVINWDHEGESFVVAFDKTTGVERWRAARDEVTSWASPIIIKHHGRQQAIVSGTERIRAYDLESGRVIWACGGLSANVVATPVFGDGMVFAASSYEKQALVAIRVADAEGDITDSKHVVWRRIQRTPYVPSPLLYEDSLYFLRHYQGILSRVEARNGAERHGPFRLNGIRNVYASPVAAANRVYVTDLDGATLVFSHTDVPETLSYNQLNDQFAASAAIVDDAIFLRGHQFLYCLKREE